jgi:OPA family glycerol-3-phosphate transporter-like MFS transporter
VENKARAKNAVWLGGATFLAYTACYAARNMLSAMAPQMVDGNVFDAAAIGNMGGVFFFSYGVGQLINGFIGNRVGAKYMTAAGLLFSGVLAAAFPFCASVPLSAALWGVCGFLCSMLWGPISRLVGENTEPAQGKVILTALSVASNFGVAVTYFFAFAAIAAGDWRIGFFIGGGAVAAAACAWYAAVGRLERKGAVARTPRGAGPQAAVSLPFRVKGFAAMTVVTMLNGVTRNAISFWTPVFLVEKLNLDMGAAAGFASVLPFLNMAGVFAALWAMRFARQSAEKMCLVLFAAAAALFAALFALDGRCALLSAAVLFAASAAMAGVCNIIFSIYVLRFADGGGLSGITGFLDFSSYMSAAAASAAFARLSAGGWRAVMLIWLASAAAGIPFSAAAIPRPRRR